MSLVDLTHHEDRGYLLSPWFQKSRETRFLEAGIKGYRLPNDRLLGVMVKTRDDRVGRVEPNGSIKKPLTHADKERLRKGTDHARKVLLAAGADPGSIIVTKIQGAHPGGTAAIGEVVDRDLQTRVKGLYVCDASVLPEAPGLPPILTIVALAKRLGRHLAGSAIGEDVVSTGEVVVH